MKSSVWHQRFLDLSRTVAEWSKDESTKCGCVIVRNNRIVATGYNGLPRDIDYRDEHLWKDRPEKYFWMEHAERNAIYNSQCDLRGTTFYITGPPCMNCARGIVQVGAKRVVIPHKHNMGTGRAYNPRNPEWTVELLRSEKLFLMTGVQYMFFNEDHPPLVTGLSDRAIYDDLLEEINRKIKEADEWI